VVPSHRVRTDVRAAVAGPRVIPMPQSHRSHLHHPVHVKIGHHPALSLVTPSCQRC
jgi:hypothetical protein